MTAAKFMVNGSGRPVTRRAQSTPGSLRHKILEPGGRVPRKRAVKRAMEKFEPKYDEHMHLTSHYHVMKALFNRLLQGQIGLGRRILDVGAGSGVLMGEALMVANAKAIQKGEVNKDILGGLPFELIILDESGPMLMRALDRIERRICQIKKDNPELGISEIKEGSTITVVTRAGVRLFEIHFLESDAMQMDQHPMIQNVDMAVTSYCYHWFRGIEEKQAVAKKTFDSLNEGGAFVSIEEYPLVVTIDETRPVTKVLANLIENATTVVTMVELQRIMMNTGFSAIPGTQIKMEIDDHHHMFSFGWRKP